MSEALLTPGQNNWGLGLNIGEGEGADKSFSHGGSNNGFRAMLFSYVDGRGVAVMTNGENGGALYSEVLNAIGTYYDWPDYTQDVRETVNLDMAILAEYEGRYVIPEFPDNRCNG